MWKDFRFTRIMIMIKVRSMFIKYAHSILWDIMYNLEVTLNYAMFYKPTVTGLEEE
jgi:hypothetical protein